MITILLATRNGERYLSELLASLEKQTAKDWQLIVHDDGSTDDTWNILQHFKKESKHQIYLKKNEIPTGSARANFATLFREAQDRELEYLMCCDQDDIWHPDKIEKTRQLMLQTEKEIGKEIPILIHSDLVVTNDQGEVLSPSFFHTSQIKNDPKLSRLLVQNQITGCTMMMNSRLWKGMMRGLFLTGTQKPAPAVIMHDYWAALYASAFGVIRIIPEPLIDYRQHDDNCVGVKNSKNFFYLWKRFQMGKKEYQKNMRDSYQQADWFLHCYQKELSFVSQKENHQLLSDYASLLHASHHQKCHVFRQYHIWKNGFIRQLMQKLWA